MEYSAATDVCTKPELVAKILLLLDEPAHLAACIRVNKVW